MAEAWHVQWQDIRLRQSPLFRQRERGTGRTTSLLQEFNVHQATNHFRGLFLVLNQDQKNYAFTMARQLGLNYITYDAFWLYKKFLLGQHVTGRFQEDIHFDHFVWECATDEEIGDLKYLVNRLPRRNPT